MELAIGTYVVFLEDDYMNGEIKRGTLGFISGHDRRGDDNTVERYIVTGLDENMRETIKTLYYDVSFLPININPTTITRPQEECDCECFGERHEFEDGSLCPCVCHDQSR